jgi:hypothetical protein
MTPGKYISTKEIIDRVIADVQYDHEIVLDDISLWIIDGLRLIAGPNQYEFKKSIINVENYRAKLPCEFLKEIQIAGSTSGCYPFAMLETSNSFHPTSENCDLDTIFTSMYNISTAQADPIGEDINGNPVYTIDQDNFALNKNLMSPSYIGYNYNEYRINNNFIFTNFKTGKVFISYKALIFDEDGYPMIPDDQRYIEAIKSFIIYKIDRLLWRKNVITENVFRDSEREWLWYVGSASNSSKLPSLDKTQKILNGQMLVRGRLHHSNFYKNLGN